MDAYTNPDWFRSVLLTIDVQRDFTVPGAPFLIPGTSEIVPTLQRLLNAYRCAGLPIIHVIRLYLADGSNVDLCRRESVEGGARMAIPNTEGSQIVKELLLSPSINLDTETLLRGKLQTVGDKEWIMYKARWGAFYKTRLEEHLRRTGGQYGCIFGMQFSELPSNQHLRGERKGLPGCSGKRRHFRTLRTWYWGTPKHWCDHPDNG